MNNLTALRRRLYLLLSVIVVAVAGYFLYDQATGYSYLSDWHVLDLMRAKFWSLGWLLFAFLVVYWRRESLLAPQVSVLALSIYFVVLYAILFRGTEYGMNGHWGDNGNRLAVICKMMAYKTFFTDWFLKDLPSFYPPLWSALMALYGKFLGIEAYQTIKFGYLLIYLTYPWLLFFSWRKIVSPAAAAGATIATIFFGYRYLDWVYHEHITASLFLPWWIYFFEDGKGSLELSRSRIGFYVIGSLYGGLLFMTYYYWFFMALAVLPFLVLVQLSNKDCRPELWPNLRHKLILGTGVAVVGAVYWLPLLMSIIRNGMESAQNIFFGVRHADLTGQWSSISVEGLLILTGIFFSFYLWDEWGRGKLPYLFLGGLLLILVDRMFNFNEGSFQSRKILEFVHVFSMAPLGIGVVHVINKRVLSKHVIRGLVGVILTLAVIVANQQTEIYEGKKYQVALKQRVPYAALEPFANVSTTNKVFLTNNIAREQCYVPIYMFITENNMSAHTASRYTQRRNFLEQIAKVKEPEYLAYALAYNRYSSVDYVYLPVDKDSGHFMFKIYEEGFNKKPEVITLSFAADHMQAPENFVARHKRGMYELVTPSRSSEIDKILQAEYPDVYQHLSPRN